jgi:RNase P subunit RPR2
MAEILVDKNINALLCPKCSGCYLHQKKAEIGIDGEDREYVEITFLCEDCPRDSILRINNQKGHTALEWQ